MGKLSLDPKSLNNALRGAMLGIVKDTRKELKKRLKFKIKARTFNKLNKISTGQKSGILRVFMHSANISLNLENTQNKRLPVFKIKNKAFARGGSYRRGLRSLGFKENQAHLKGLFVYKTPPMDKLIMSLDPIKIAKEAA